MPSRNALRCVLAAPPHTVFVWAVKAADDGCRYALQDTVVGKGHWNQVACSTRLFPHGAAETRTWTEPTNFIMGGSRLFKAGFFTDKFRTVGFDPDPPDLGCTVRQLQLSFRDGSLFKDSPKS